MTANTMSTDGTTTFRALQPFEACPSPSPNAPVVERTPHVERRTEVPASVRQDRGWVSPCCFMPR